MPYEKEVYGRLKSKFNKLYVPLKMFDYLASSQIIVATNQVYNHILKNKYN